MRLTSHPTTPIPVLSPNIRNASQRQISKLFPLHLYTLQNPYLCIPSDFTISTRNNVGGYILAPLPNQHITSMHSHLEKALSRPLVQIGLAVESAYFIGRDAKRFDPKGSALAWQCRLLLHHRDSLCIYVGTTSCESETFHYYFSRRTCFLYQQF